MKVSELKKILETVNPDSEVKILLPADGEQAASYRVVRGYEVELPRKGGLHTRETTGEFTLS